MQPIFFFREALAGGRTECFSCFMEAPQDNWDNWKIFYIDVTSLWVGAQLATTAPY